MVPVQTGRRHRRLLRYPAVETLVLAFRAVIGQAARSSWMWSSNPMGASIANVAPHALWRGLSGRDLLGLFFGNLLIAALLVALGRRLLQGLHNLFAFGLLLTTGLDHYHLLASCSVYSRSSSGPPSTS